MEPDDPSGDSDAEMDLFVQQEVEASRSAHPPSGFVGVEIRDAGRDNERFQAKTKRSLAVPLGFEKGMQVRVPGSYDTAREAVEARGRFVFQTLRRVRCADAYLHTHPCRTHTHHTCNPALPCLFSSSPIHTPTHPLLIHYCVRAQLGTSGSSGNTAAVTAAATATATAGVSSASIDQGAAIYEYGSTCAFFCIVIIRDPARRVVGGVEFMAEESADGRRHRRGSAAPTTPMIHLHSAQSPARSPAQSTADPQLIHSPIPSPIHS